MDKLPEREYVGRETFQKRPVDYYTNADSLLEDWEELRMPTDRRQEELRKLAIAEAVLWAEANGVDVHICGHEGPNEEFRAGVINKNAFAFGATWLEAINNLRAKVEPTAKGDGITDDTEAVQRGAPLAPGETKTAPDKRVPAGSYRAAKSCTECGGEGVHKMSCSSQHTHKHDKRVPAELWSDLRDNLFSGDVELRERLEACPDITDEPATLHQTAQAVLDAATRWIPPDVPRGDDVALCEAWSSWDMAGRPTVVGAGPDCIPASGHRFENGTCSKCGAVYNAVSPEDAATLQALRRCRELRVVPMQSATKWRVAFRAEFDRETLPEALAAYEAAQRQKDLRPTCWCCRKKWPDFPPKGIDAQVYPCGDCSELVRDMFIASRGPRCPDKSEDSEP